jgi:hypothetical protein
LTLSLVAFCERDTNTFIKASQTCKDNLGCDEHELKLVVAKASKWW